jgi:Predicted membrane protein (DUF2207)
MSTHLMKQHILAFGRALLLSAVFSSAALAAPRVPAKSATYLRRDYTVTIQRNGDVHFVEHWQVQFTGGPFHTAFVRIYLVNTIGVHFGQVVGADPGSQMVSQTTDSYGNPMTQLDWTFPSTQDATRSFDMPYTIHGGFGVGSPQAWLDWHFLDANDPSAPPVDESTITITLPAVTQASSLHLATADADTTPTVKTLDASTVQVSAQHLAGGSPLEVEVAFPNAELDASVQRQPWQTTDTPPALPTALGQTNSQPVVTTGPGGVLAPLTGLCGLGFVPIMFFFLMIFAFMRSIMGVGPRGGYLGGQRPWGGWGGP